MKPAVRMISQTFVVDDPDYDDHLNIESPLELIEFVGRWDYGEANVAKTGSNPEWLRKRLADGEESMVEIIDVGFLITCSRVVSHELVRHRLATFQQESQRFTKYEAAVAADLFFVPEEIKAAVPNSLWGNYRGFLLQALAFYKLLRAAGIPPQIARYVLPNAMGTHLVMKANLREWRHILHQRMNKSAQPETQEIARLIHGKLQREYGVDLFPDSIADERVAR